MYELQTGKNKSIYILMLIIVLVAFFTILAYTLFIDSHEYKYSQNIRSLLFKHSANMEFYDKIRLSFNSNKNYISQIEEIYDKLGSVTDYFGFTSFKKKEWILILNDIIQIYSNMDFI